MLTTMAKIEYRTVYYVGYFFFGGGGYELEKNYLNLPEYYQWLFLVTEIMDYFSVYFLKACLFPVFYKK